MILRSYISSPPRPGETENRRPGDQGAPLVERCGGALDDTMLLRYYGESPFSIGKPTIDTGKSTTNT